MSFVNVGGNLIHTSALSTTGSSGTMLISGTNSNLSVSTGAGYLTWGGSTVNYSVEKTTFHVLGEDIEVTGFCDENLPVIISTLNVLGKPFYDEAIKNGIVFPEEIENYLQYKLKVVDRDRKINDLLK